MGAGIDDTPASRHGVRLHTLAEARNASNSVVISSVSGRSHGPHRRSAPPDAAVYQLWSTAQLWISVKVVPHLPGSVNSDSASRRSEASSRSLTDSSSRDSSATLNWSGRRRYG